MRTLVLSLIACFSSLAHANVETYVVKLNRAHINYTRANYDNDSVYFRLSRFDADLNDGVPNDMRRDLQYEVTEAIRLPNLFSGDTLYLADANNAPDVAAEFAGEVELRPSDDLELAYLFTNQSHDKMDPDRAYRDFLNAAASFRQAVDGFGKELDGAPLVGDVAKSIAWVVDKLEDAVVAIFGGDDPQVSCDGLVLVDGWHVSAADLAALTAATGSYTWVKHYDSEVTPKACGHAPSTDLTVTVTHTGTIGDIVDHNPLAVVPWSGVPGASWDGLWGDAPFTNHSRVLATISRHVTLTRWPIRTGLQAMIFDNGGDNTQQPTSLAENHDVDLREADAIGNTVASLHATNIGTAAESVPSPWSANVWPITWGIGVSTCPGCGGGGSSSTFSPALSALFPGMTVVPISETAHPNATTALRLYAVLSSTKRVQGYRLRYTRTDSVGHILTDAMLQPSAYPPQ